MLSCFRCCFPKGVSTNHSQPNKKNEQKNKSLFSHTLTDINDIELEVKPTTANEKNESQLFFPQELPQVLNSEAQASSESTDSISIANRRRIPDSNYYIFTKFNHYEAEIFTKQTGIIIPSELFNQDIAKFSIASGNFGKLKIAYSPDTKQFYGLKKIVGLDKMISSQNECAIQRSLGNTPNTMPILHSVTYEGKNSIPAFYVVMPLAGFGNGGQLVQYLQLIPDVQQRYNLIAHVVNQLLIGIQGMHNMQAVEVGKRGPIFHLDLKPENFVINKEGEVFIIDFGCAARASADNLDGIMQYTNGDSYYYSPERVAHNRWYFASLGNTYQVNEQAEFFSAKNADIWALGMTIFKLATGIIPINKIKLPEKLDLWDAKHFEIELNNTYSQYKNLIPDSLMQIIKGFLRETPITIEEALESSFFKEYSLTDFDKHHINITSYNSLQSNENLNEEYSDLNKHYKPVKPTQYSSTQFPIIQNKLDNSDSKIPSQKVQQQSEPKKSGPTSKSEVPENSNDTPQNGTLSILPPELMNYILEFLTKEYRAQTIPVSKYFYNMHVTGSFEIDNSKTITDKQFASLLLYLKSEPCKISTLNLSKHDLSIIDPGQTETRFTRLCTILKNKPSLNSLNISECNLAKLDNINSITELKQITNLNLAGNRLSDNQIESIKDMQNLIELNISHNQITAIGTNYIVNIEKLSILDISFNPLEIAGIKNIGKMTNIIELNAAYTKINDEGTIHISSMLKLVKLNVSDNNIKYFGIVTLSKMKGLTHLNFSFNDLDSLGSKAISEMPNLICLIAQSCKLEDASIKSLSSMKLAILHLDDNDITNVGSEYILNMQESLIELTIMDNKIDNTSIQKIKEMKKLTKFIYKYDETSIEEQNRVNEMLKMMDMLPDVPSLV